MPNDIADRDRRMAVAKWDGVVPVATHLRVGGARQIARRELDPGQVRKPVGQEAALKRLGDLGSVLDLDRGAAQALHRRADDHVVCVALRRRPSPLSGDDVCSEATSAECRPELAQVLDSWNQHATTAQTDTVRAAWTTCTEVRSRARQAKATHLPRTGWCG